MRHNFQATQRDRHQRIFELRHRLRYTTSEYERDSIRAELDFWMRRQ
jgi:hypothetical protein